jgi:hypothetical protein
MSVCTECGHPLGVGSFCTNCGQPVDESGPVSEDTIIADDWRTGTAERPAVAGPTEPTIEVGRPVLPPPVTTASEAPRYPLYADEAVHDDSLPDDRLPDDRLPDDNLHDDDAMTSTENHRHVGERQPRSATAIWVPWLVGAAVLVLVGAVGIWLLLSSGDDTTPTASDPAANGASPDSPTASDSKQPKPSSKPSKDKSDKPGKTADVSRSATATVPATAPPNEDVDGNLVRYEGRNMLDGVPETTWRMVGDGTGKTITFDLAEPTTITEVGMINGYAKTATDHGRKLDWYAGNRRVLEVEWVFDDGTTVSQDFERTRNLQTIRVDHVTTSSVQVRLVSVSKPGSGPSARNNTAISEVSLVGSPG